MRRAVFTLCSTNHDRQQTTRLNGKAWLATAEICAIISGVTFGLSMAVFFQASVSAPASSFSCPLPPVASPPRLLYPWVARSLGLVVWVAPGSMPVIRSTWLRCKLREMNKAAPHLVHNLSMWTGWHSVLHQHTIMRLSPALKLER